MYFKHKLIFHVDNTFFFLPYQLSYKNFSYKYRKLYQILLVNISQMQENVLQRQCFNKNLDHLKFPLLMFFKVQRSVNFSLNPSTGKRKKAPKNLFKYLCVKLPAICYMLLPTFKCYAHTFETTQH